MSVADLIGHVDEAMIKGFRLHKGGKTYANLQTEAERLRAENNELTDEIDRLKVAREKHVGKYKTEEVEIIEATKTVQEIDSRLAGLRKQHVDNIGDVGSLKVAMSRIEKTGNVLALVDEIEDSLNLGEVLIEDGPLVESLIQMLDGLQDEYNKVSPKIASYGKAREELAKELFDLEREVREQGEFSGRHQDRGVDNLLQKIMAKLLQDKRMVDQLDRLRQLQTLNSDLIGRLERSKTNLARHATINRLISSGDAAQIQAKVEELNGDLERLRMSILKIESRLDAHAREGEETIASLRSMKTSLTSAMAQQRELLFSNIRQEGQWKARLAILRGQKLRTLRFIGLLRDALPE